MLKAMLVLLGGLALAPSANAQGPSALKYKSGCEDAANPGRNKNPTPVEINNAGYCTGLVTGLMTKANSPSGVPVGSAICEPSGVTVRQAILVVIKYMNDNPQQLHEPLYKVALLALANAWPCTRQ
jgi:hypothetical protein